MPHQGTSLDFPSQAANEDIFIYTRRYPVAFLPMLALIILMGVMGGAVIALLGIDAIIPYNIVIFTGSAYLLFVLLFAIVEFFDFYFDVNIVTDRRIVDINQNKLFSRSVSELLLEDVQDVHANTTGFLSTLFNFGNVEIQTSGTKPNFTFERILHPTETAAIILDLTAQARRGVPITERHPTGPVAAIINDVLLPHTPDHTGEVELNI